MSLAEWYRLRDWQAFAIEFEIQFELCSGSAEELKLLRSLLVEYRNEDALKAVVMSGVLS